MRGLDGGAGGGEDPNAHEDARADLRAKADLEDPDNLDCIEGENDVAHGHVGWSYAPVIGLHLLGKCVNSSLPWKYAKPSNMSRAVAGTRASDVL